MAGDWRVTTLGECASWLSGGTPSKGNQSYWEGDIPWVSAKDMKSFRLHDAEDHIARNAVGNGAKLVPPGTILMLVRGMTLHKDVPISMTSREVAFNQDIKALRPVEGVDGEFLAYWLLANKPNLLAIVDHAGHGTGRLVTNTVKEKRVLLPLLPAQRAIAHVLGTLGDLIDLNRETNEILEEMARALFKSWFVDFDPVRAKLEGRPPAGMDPETAALFPDHFEDSELGQIPKGWEVGALSEIASIQNQSVNPGSKPDQIWEHYSIPAFDAGAWPASDKGSEIKSGKYRIPDRAVLLSKLNPNTPRVWLPDVEVAGNAICSTEFLPFVPPSGSHPSFVFESLRSEPVFSEICNRATGSTGSRQQVKPGDVARIETVVPPDEIIEAFVRVAGPHHDMIASNRRESRDLAALRDTLLPKLLSGVLSVSALDGAAAAS